MPGFKCSTCGKWHEEIPDLGYREPLYAIEVAEAERPKRLYLTSDFCILDDEHFFIRCILHVPIKGSSESFAYGIWSSLSRENFGRYRTHYDEDMSDWEPMFGWLSNRLPGYPDTLSLKLFVQPGPKNARPTVTLEPTDHPLAIEQREGITQERLSEILGPLLHQ